MGRLTNQLVSISEMSESVAIATRNETTDDYGAQIASVEEPLVYVRAKVRYDSTNEQENNDQLKFETKIKIHTRYNSDWTVEKLVFWNDTYYEIYAVETTPGNRFHVIKARLIET